MFQFLNRRIGMRCLKKRLGNCSGQIAIVMILVIAAALIFYAVTLNLGDFAFSQAVVTVASNTSASMLASNMASYTQAISSTTLGGKQKICAWTGIMAAIITIIIIIIIIIISWICPPVGGSFWASGGALLIAGLVIASVALVIQMVVIQPGLTDAWNRITSKTLSMQNQFTENAIQNAFGKAVTDNVLVPDVVDSDGDRLWVPEAAIGTVPYADTISRYSMYYSERLRQIKEELTVAEIEVFRTALENFLYQDTDDWGIHDPMLGANCRGRAECHACCVPWSATVGEEDVEGLRSEECEEFDNDAFWEPKCSIASPYQAPPGTQSYPWIFDIYYENPDNMFYSFRELLGLDDEHQDYYKDPDDPNSDPSGIIGAGRKSQFFHVAGERGWSLEDTTGFYVPPFYPFLVDRRVGIFPFFYKMSDWGVDLDAASNVDFVTNPESRECHWCDPNPANPGNCIPCAGKSPHFHPLEIPQLVLPLDPTDPTNNIIYNTTWHVDGFPSVGGDPPLAVDRVTASVPSGNIVADPDVCAGYSLYPSVTSNGFWKPGGDRFCKGTAAYFLDCSKCSDEYCTCPGTGANNFPDDVLDDIIYGLPEFIAWAQSVLVSGADSRILSRIFPAWYEDAAVWIEPKDGEGPCFYCGSLTLPDGTPIDEGILHIWLKELTRMRDRIEEWITNDGSGYLGAGCNDVWCLPSDASCPGIPSGEGEDETFDANNNGVQGDVEDIVSCLKFNVTGYDHVAAEAFASGGPLPTYHLDGETEIEYAAGTPFAINPPTVKDGNDMRFRHCASTCSVSECNRLPRSLVPGFDTTGFQAWDWDPVAAASGPISAILADARFLDLTAFNDCLESCSAENCEVGPRLPTVHTSDGVTPYVYPPVGTPLDCVTNWGVFLAGNPWYDTIMANKIDIEHDEYYEITRMARCAYDCNKNIADCQLMPEVQYCTGDPDIPGSELPYIWPDIDGDGIPDTPSSFTISAHCDPVTHRPLPPWDAAIAANIMIHGGPSCDTAPGGWLDSARQSSFEAVNQVVKFDKRLHFFERDMDYNDDGVLDFTIGRLAEAKEIIAILTEAIDKFTEFLIGPAKDLINARIAYSASSEDTGLPYEAIYGWRDGEDPSAPNVRGKWHIVKVEARITGMCDNRCAADQVGPDPPWPTVKTYTKNWGMKRCYELINTSGSVKFRTTRWDEAKSAKPCASVSPCPPECGGNCGLGSTVTYVPAMTFPNGTPIWSFKANNPLRPVDRSVTNPDNLDGYCAGSTIATLPGTYTGTTIYMGAFIMHKYFPLGYDNDNADCWNLAHRLLSSGYSNETCAEYYWHDGMNRGMGIEFVDCKPF